MSGTAATDREGKAGATWSAPSGSDYDECVSHRRLARVVEDAEVDHLCVIDLVDRVDDRADP